MYGKRLVNRRTEKQKLCSMKEDDVHISIVEWFEVVKPEGAVLHHSPNESWKSNVSWRMKQKRMGVRHGFPDLLILCPMDHWKWSHHYAPILLEVKTAKGIISQNQESCISDLKNADCHVHIVRSIDDAAECLIKYMELKIVGRA